MNSHRRLSGILRWPLILAALTGMLAGEALAKQKPTGTEDAYKFELRAFGSKIGEGVLSVGPKQKIGGKELRAVRLDAKTEGLGAKVYKAVATATSWVNNRWLPVRARWDAELPKGKRMVKAKWDKKIVEGEYHFKGKLQRKFKTRFHNHATDLVSVYTWMANQRLKPGAVYQQPLYDGKRFFWLKATVRDPQEIHVPVGVRKAYPIQITIKRRKYEKKLVYWVGDDRTPLKLSFSYGVLGTVDAVLVAKRKVETIAMR